MGRCLVQRPEKRTVGMRQFRSVADCEAMGEENRGGGGWGIIEGRNWKEVQVGHREGRGGWFIQFPHLHPFYIVQLSAVFITLKRLYWVSG